MKWSEGQGEQGNETMRQSGEKGNGKLWDIVTGRVKYNMNGRGRGKNMHHSEKSKVG